MRKFLNKIKDIKCWTHFHDWKYHWIKYPTAYEVFSLWGEIKPDSYKNEKAPYFQIAVRTCQNCFKKQANVEIKSDYVNVNIKRCHFKYDYNLNLDESRAKKLKELLNG